MISLETLRAHALKNPDKEFPLNSCTACLASDLTGEEMAGFGYTEGGQAVDPKFAAFCSRICETVDGDYPLTGAQIAGAIDRIESGVHPYDAANEVRENLAQ